MGKKHAEPAGDARAMDEVCKAAMPVREVCKAAMPVRDSGTRERRRRSEEERESEGDEVKMKQMKAEELGVLVRWTTKTRQRCQWERFRKQHVRKKHAEPAGDARAVDEVCKAAMPVRDSGTRA